ncbi:Alpha-L-iduronidase like protein [Argiope bruennichi]|uniref:Alpha-L-iduronidase like protein n=1 Tax=Argiope bruennichi TaxID=94029 RepID=A0A8T0FKT9_ARGBR|nr:Alpha-L-iduronidase like protein [Argiope bruennichi]
MEENRTSNRSTMRPNIYDIICEECGRVIHFEMLEYHMKKVHYIHILKPLHNNNIDRSFPRSFHMSNSFHNSRSDTHVERVPAKVFYPNKSNYCMQFCLAKPNNEIQSSFDFETRVAGSVFVYIEYPSTLYADLVYVTSMEAQAFSFRSLKYSKPFSEEITIFLYNSADTYKNGSVADVDIYLNISYLKGNTSARWAIHEINNRKSNPYIVWENIGMPSYPSVQDFSLMKSKEEPYMRGPWYFTDSTLWKYKLNVLNPGITLIHICERPQKLYKVKNMRFLQIWKKTLQISWTDLYNRCLSSYIVLYSFDLHGSYHQLNKKRLLFPSYWHACLNEKRNCSIKGFYKVLSVDYWGRRGPTSEIFHFKG